MRLIRNRPFRARLALAFAGLFLLTGTGLLAFVVLLARYGTAEQVKGIEVTRGDWEDTGEATREATGEATGELLPTGVAQPGGGDDFLAIRQLDQTVQAVQETALRQMVLWSAVGLLLMAVVAGLLGWWLAGRALRPVAAMTEATRRMSEQNLHQRLALTGPDDELHRLADTFDGMLDRLERSFESQRRFVANASHELRTPLAVQRASLEVGLADPLPDGLAEVREDLLTANREAEALITALLLLARSDRGTEATEPVDLAQAARQVTAELAEPARAAGVTVTVDGPPLTVVGDPVLLRHLLTNLVDNAIRYNRPGGRVLVAVADRALTVTNSGPTIAPDRIPDLFEPFRRLGQDRTGTTGATGHGLGLSIVRSIAAAHGTWATAEPGPEGGLTVTVRFP
ncbi:ATP-binding protein [Streptomyces carpaticus]|uniref:sensor histidine kinase n=1 Tax=Streptomyces TaxID=1883 RepID=UPI0022074108|nr:ATP-binding protein [Streptomyces carpaticus]